MVNNDSYTLGSTSQCHLDINVLPNTNYICLTRATLEPQQTTNPTEKMISIRNGGIEPGQRSLQFCRQYSLAARELYQQQIPEVEKLKQESSRRALNKLERNTSATRQASWTHLDAGV